MESFADRFYWISLTSSISVHYNTYSTRPDPTVRYYSILTNTCCSLGLQLYDLANPGLTRNSVAGCPQTEDLCMQLVGHRCSEHGSCVGSMVEPRCECSPGWSGADCLTPTIPTTFRPQSYVKYALSFDADKFMTKIQLRFRTREEHGELFRVSDQHNREYAILEVGYCYYCYYYNMLPI